MAEAEKSDGDEMGEWLDALDFGRSVRRRGPRRRLARGRRHRRRAARARGCRSPSTPPMSTPSIPRIEPPHPGDREMEQTIRHAVRWNAAAIVVKANKESSELGGHIASFQSAATLYDTGFMHFWRAADETHGGDLIYFQGHISPGIYARAFLEGRLSEEQLLQLPPGGRRQGAFLLSASLADAGFLAVPHRVDGPRAADGDLSGAVSEISP